MSTKMSCAQNLPVVATLATLFVLLSIIHVTQASQQIALGSVSVDNGNDTLTVTVTYTADHQQQPEVSWVLPTFRAGQYGIVSLAFEQTDLFNNGQGQTAMRIHHDEALTQNPKIFLRFLILRHPDCEIKVEIPPFQNLINSPPPSATQTFDNLALVLDTEGRVLDPGQDLVLRWRHQEITATLSSPELSKFEVSNPWVSLATFDYAPGDFVGRVNDYGYRNEDAFKHERKWVGSDTTKRLKITMKRPSTGILQLYMLTLNQIQGEESLVPSIELRQNIYILRSPGVEIVKRNTVYVTNEHLHTLSEFDMPMSLDVPKFSFTVVGNPLPQVSLYRACSEVSEEEAEVFETRVYSRYEITYFFRFRNASEATAGSYNVVARSGTMEAREIMSLGIV